MTEEQIKELVKWVALEAEHESLLLSPMPEWNINAHSLLDKISELTGITKETIGKWVKEAQEQ